MEKTSTRGSQSAGIAALYSTYLLMSFTTFGYRYPQVTHWFLWGSLQAWHYCLHTWEQLQRLYSRALSYKMPPCLHKPALRKSKPRNLHLKHLAKQSGQKHQLPLHSSPRNLSTAEYSEQSDFLLQCLLEISPGASFAMDMHSNWKINSGFFLFTFMSHA